LAVSIGVAAEEILLHPAAAIPAAPVKAAWDAGMALVQEAWVLVVGTMPISVRPWLARPPRGALPVVSFTIKLAAPYLDGPPATESIFCRGDLFSFLLLSAQAKQQRLFELKSKTVQREWRRLRPSDRDGDYRADQDAEGRGQRKRIVFQII
jgi:hypothetical protein